MISIKELERKHKKLTKEVETNDYYKVDLTDRVNVYTCDEGHQTKTIDVDPGCTPFYHECAQCKELAKSSFYNDIAPLEKPTQEWYRPDLKELKKLRKDEHLLDHIFKGGLIHRSIKVEK